MRDVIKLTSKEIDFLKKNEACRIATSYNDIPHVTPVTYYVDDVYFYIATDYDTRKYTNMKKNNKVAVTVDIYSAGKHKAVIIQGTAEFIERGIEFKKLYEIFHKKFAWVREMPWKEGEAPFVKIKPLNKISWGLTS